MSGLIAWFASHLGELFALLAALHGVALIVVNLTPTPRDNEIVGKIYKIIEWIAGLFTRTSKELPGERAGM